MPEIPVIKTTLFLKKLIKYGCEEISTRGSHHKISYKGRIAIVPVHVGKDLKKGLLPKILADLGIDIDRFIAFLK